jgi:hypothetical protein
VGRDVDDDGLRGAELAGLQFPIARSDLGGMVRKLEGLPEVDGQALGDEDEAEDGSARTWS